MKKKNRLLLAASIVNYSVAFIYTFLTACFYSMSDKLYWLFLVLALLSLWSGLGLDYVRQRLDIVNEKKIRIIYFVFMAMSIVTVVGTALSLVVFLLKDDTPLEEKEIKVTERPKKKWYKRSNFILAVSSFLGIFLFSFSAHCFETSGFTVQVSDFTLTKAMTEEYNAGDINKLVGHNYVIEDDMLSFSCTQYVPKKASEANPYPVVFVMPGFTRTKATMAQYAIELSRRGFVVFTMDPGCQGATTAAGYKEDGSMISSTVGCNGLNYLVQYVYNNLETYNYIDRDRIGAVGHSAGGGNVCQLAENFSGTTYEESVIKALYISGYIKLSAANRFQNLRCNAAMSYAYYDEGAFRYQDSSNSFEIVSLMFINDVNGKDKNNYYNFEIDKAYGSYATHDYRIIHHEDINHCFEMYDKKSIANTLNFFRNALDSKTTIKDTSMIWFGKEGSNGLALVCGFILVYAVASLVVTYVPFMKSLKKAGAERIEKENDYRVAYGDTPVYIDPDFVSSRDEVKEKPVPKSKKKSIYDKVMFWTLLAIGAVVACLDFIPCARLSMTWMSDAASNTYTFQFPARMVNAVVLWAVFNGTFGLILYAIPTLIENLVYFIRGQKEKIDWRKFTLLKVKPLDLLKSLGLAVVLFGVFFGMVSLVNVTMHQDFRFMLISASPLQPRMVVTWLIYLIPFLVFYLSNSIRVNLSIAYEGWSEWKTTLVAALANSLGLVFILVVNYVCYFLTGTVFYGYYSPTDYSEMWLFVNMVFALIPMMFLLPILNRIAYKLSGNVYFGALLNCMIFIMMTIGASVSYIPM